MVIVVILVVLGTIIAACVWPTGDSSMRQLCGATRPCNGCLLGCYRL